jgi:glycosyltransferase involved in cell wall biosynthesis
MPMKILFVSPFFVPICGGVEAVLDTTATALAKRGHSIEVLTSSLPGVAPAEARGGVRVIRAKELDVPDSGVIDPADFDFRAEARFMRQVTEEFQPDVVHFHNYQMRQYSMFLQAFLSGIQPLGIPTLDTIHNDTDDPFAHYVLSYSPLDAVVTVTKKGAIQLLEAGLPEGRLRYVPNMVDADQFRRANRQVVRRLLGVDEDVPLILFPSRIIGREGNLLLDSKNGKGLDILLRALPEVFEAMPSTKVLLLGNDPVFHEKVSACKRKLKVIADKVGAGSRLLFFNQFVPNSMLPEIFAAADIVVSLSLRETFGMVFIEGMAAGKPVVGVNSTYGGVSEVVPDNHAGILVPPDDPHSTAKAISRILLNDDLRASMGINGVKWVKKHFDTSTVIPQLEQVYDGLRRPAKPEEETLLNPFSVKSSGYFKADRT